jgi:hypothetical protein
LHGSGVRDFLKRVSVRRLRVIGIERFETAPGANRIDVTLSQNGTKPGFEGAASVEIAEEGAFAAGAVRKTVEFREERIRQIAGFRRCTAAAENGSSGSAKIGTIGADKVIPCGLGIFHAGSGEGEIFQMESGEILADFFGREVSARQPFLRAALERGGESLEGQAPAVRLGLGVKRFQAGRRRPGQSLARDGADDGIRRPRGVVWGIFLHSRFKAISGISRIAKHPTPGVWLASYEHNPAQEGVYVKLRSRRPPTCGILYGLRAPTPQQEPPRRVSSQGARCARDTISDFATLVRKSYSDTLSPVSTLVLAKRTNGNIGFERQANLGELVFS